MPWSLLDIARTNPRRPRADDDRSFSSRAPSTFAAGEAELRGTDHFGAVLNRAARVMAAGHGGQILLAESTAVLLSGVDLVDLGPRRLRDLTDGTDGTISFATARRLGLVRSFQGNG